MTVNIKVPSTYAEWVEMFNILKANTDDEAILSTMKQGTIEWQSGVAERFTKRLVDVVNYRMNIATDRFQKEITRSNGEERVIVQSLLALRKELNFLAQAMNLPVIPEKDRQQYCNLVREQANSIQQSLEDSAKKDRSGKLSSIIRNNKVNTF